MLHRTLVFLVLPGLWCPAIGQADPSEPSNYDECIVDTMRGVSSDVAARAIIESCRNLFPASEDEAAPQVTPAPAPAPTPARAVAAPDAAVPATPAAVPAAADSAPLDTSGARSLTADELARVRARASVFGSTYRVTIENDNPSLTLTEVTIAVWDDTDSAAGRKEYSEAVEIAPQTSSMVKYIVHYRGDETGWNWGVVAARGVE